MFENFTDLLVFFRAVFNAPGASHSSAARGVIANLETIEGTPTRSLQVTRTANRYLKEQRLFDALYKDGDMGDILFDALTACLNEFILLIDLREDSAARGFCYYVLNKRHNERAKQ